MAPPLDTPLTPDAYLGFLFIAQDICQHTASCFSRVCFELDGCNNKSWGSEAKRNCNNEPWISKVQREIASRVGAQ
jgi:hypothetical protein